MTARVIQGSFVGTRPKLPASVQPGTAPPPPIQAKIAAPTSATAFASRPPRPPIPAFGARPSGPPAPASAQRAGAVQRHGAGNAFAIDSGVLGLASGGGKPLPDSVRGKMEAALGADFSNVRVHVGPQAERIGAIAFTIGSDIYFAPGRYQPDTVQGQQLLGHELSHVVQQRAGRVRNALGSGLAVVQDHALEAEADRLGQRAAMHRVAVQPKMASILVTPCFQSHNTVRAVQGGMFTANRISPLGRAGGLARRAPTPVIQSKGWTWNGGSWDPDSGSSMPQPAIRGSAVGARLVTSDPPTVVDVVADCSDDPLSIGDYNRGRDYAHNTFGFAGHRAHKSNAVHLHPRSRLQEMADAGATVQQLQEVVRLWGR
jgi:hypothetical protein